MTRMLSLSTLLVSGCIIYEEDWDDGDCRRCDTGFGSTVPGDDDDDDGNPGTTEPEPEPGPIVTTDLELTPTSAYPGDSLLSSLVVVSGSFDLATIETVSFERDVLVLDQLARPGEIVLLLSVADDATPGEVDVFVETAQGEGYILATPFTVLEAGATCGGGDGGDGTGGDGNGDGTGGGTGDTGCP